MQRDTAVTDWSQVQTTVLPEVTQIMWIDASSFPKHDYQTKSPYSICAKSHTENLEQLSNIMTERYNN